MTRGEQVEMKIEELAKNQCIGDSIKRVPFIHKLLVRIAIYEIFLEAEELDASFKFWASKRNNEDRKERGLPKTNLEWS